MFFLFCLILVFVLSVVIFVVVAPEHPRKKQQIEKTKTCFPRYLFSLFSLSHSFTFLLFLYLLWLFVVVVVVVVGCWLLLVVVVGCCCLLLLLFCCFVVCLVKGTPTKESTTKKNNKTPCFIVFFALLCLEAFGQRKANRPRANE